MSVIEIKINAWQKSVKLKISISTCKSIGAFCAYYSGSILKMNSYRLQYEKKYSCSDFSTNENKSTISSHFQDFIR